ncbi:high-affinity lysophosphatidic acid receptor-like [Rhopilema esculentum]|uniref:high-affinity lysophosphatidic acid receptor-like n=1 Tax=Rhopilema esculentum TaxID=499914 RepID=UPI0031E36D52|eukprot:gene10451-19161_t
MAAVEIEATILVVIFLGCLIGNCMMCLVVFKDRKTRPRIYSLLGNLAIADLGLGLFCMPFTIITLLSRKWILGPKLCQANGFMNAFWIPATVFATTGISIHKCHSMYQPFNPKRTWRITKVFVTITWLLSFACGLGPLLGWHKFTYNPSSSQCGLGVSETKADYSYMVFLAVFVYSIPMLSNIVSFVLLFRAVQKHTLRIRQNAVLTSNNTSTQKRTAVTFLLVFLSYILSWTPFFIYGLLKIAGVKGDLAGQYLTVAYLMGFSNTVHNPIIFAFRNQSFRESFKEIIFSIFGHYRRKLRTMTTVTLTSNFSFQMFNKTDDELSSVWYLADNSENTEAVSIESRERGMSFESSAHGVTLQAVRRHQGSMIQHNEL